MSDTINLHSWEKKSALFRHTNVTCNTVSDYYTVKRSLMLMNVAKSHYIMAQHKKKKKMKETCYTVSVNYIEREGK
jgi:hypothetical protein